MKPESVKKVKLGAVVLGEGRPKVCVPVMGGDPEEIAHAAQLAAAAGAEMIELRIDSMSPMPTTEEAIKACRAVRAAAKETPLLFTLRTQRDGGAGSADAECYEALLCKVARAGVCEAIDVELSVGEEAFARLVEAAHDSGVCLVGSSHEFGEMKDARTAGEWLKKQEALGADVCKAAVMPRDGLQAMELALEMMRAAQGLHVPYIGIVMGREGVLTRVGAQALGSCLTFGAAGKASAPGQMDAPELKRVLEAIDKAL